MSEQSLVYCTIKVQDICYPYLDYRAVVENFEDCLIETCIDVLGKHSGIFMPNYWLNTPKPHAAKLQIVIITSFLTLAVSVPLPHRSMLRVELLGGII
jgi:hypothetical protein